MFELSPCRCCGETDHLEVNTAFHDCDWVYTSDNRIKREANGAFSVEAVDYVECLICNTTAPRDHWNITNADWAARRAATLAAWHEAERVSEIVSLYLRKQFRKDPHPLDSWKKTGIRASAPTVLNRLEKAIGLPVTPKAKLICSSVEDIVNGLAGRLTSQVAS